MEDSRITEFFEMVKKLVKLEFEKKGELSMAHFFMLKDNQIIQVPVPLVGNKDHVSAVLKMAASQVKPEALSFVSECWIVSRKAVDGQTIDDLKNSTTGIDVSAEPDRTECLMFNNETKSKAHMVTIPINRNESGAPTLGEPNSMEGADTSGRFVHLLCVN